MNPRGQPAEIAAPFRCAEAARARSDPPLGTAPPTRRWLLVEHPGPWRPEAFAESGIAPHIRRSLADAATTAGGRILLMRRPGRRRGEPAVRSWAVVDVRDGTSWGSWSHDRDLLLAAQALTEPSWPHSRREEPVLLVCTHGVHDACCAIRGRPVVAALAARWPDQTWECSHVGGDRFAANVVVLPDGVYYGNLGVDEAVSAIGQHLDGKIAVPYLRGWAAYPPAAQVAVGAVHERYGPYAADAVTADPINRLGPTTWLVVVHGPAGTARVTVQTHHRAEAQLTCGALRATSAMSYQVVAMESGAS